MLGDPFETFRTLLAAFIAVYTALYLLVSLRTLHGWLAGDDPGRLVLRRYLAYQMLSVRVRRFTRELVELLAWSVAFVCLWCAHACI